MFWVCVLVFPSCFLTSSQHTRSPPPLLVLALLQGEKSGGGCEVALMAFFLVASDDELGRLGI